MIAKKTSKNQITLPKKIVEQFPDCDYFDVTAEDGTILLRPVAVDALRRVQEKLERLGMTQTDVADAVSWARRERE